MTHSRLRLWIYVTGQLNNFCPKPVTVHFDWIGLDFFKGLPARHKVYTEMPERCRPVVGKNSQRERMWAVGSPVAFLRCTSANFERMKLSIDNHSFRFRFSCVYLTVCVQTILATTTSACWPRLLNGTTWSPTSSRVCREALYGKTDGAQRSFPKSSTAESLYYCTSSN